MILDAVWAALVVTLSTLGGGLLALGLAGIITALILNRGHE